MYGVFHFNTITHIEQSSFIFKAFMSKFMGFSRDSPIFKGFSRVYEPCKSYFVSQGTLEIGFCPLNSLQCYKHTVRSSSTNVLHMFIIVYSLISWLCVSTNLDHSHWVLEFSAKPSINFFCCKTGRQGLVWQKLQEPNDCDLGLLIQLLRIMFTARINLFTGSASSFNFHPPYQQT